MFDLSPLTKALHLPPEIRFQLYYVADQPGCWPWLGAQTAKGYGQFRVDGRTVAVHRYQYEMLYGPIPKAWKSTTVAKTRSALTLAILR
jgi:hypothetical protein